MTFIWINSLGGLWGEQSVSSTWAAAQLLLGALRKHGGALGADKVALTCSLLCGLYLWWVQAPVINGKRQLLFLGPALCRAQLPCDLHYLFSRNGKMRSWSDLLKAAQLGSTAVGECTVHIRPTRLRPAHAGGVRDEMWKYSVLDIITQIETWATNFNF